MRENVLNASVNHFAHGSINWMRNNLEERKHNALPGSVLPHVQTLRNKRVVKSAIND